MGHDQCIDVIIPTWNNPDYLFPAVQSLHATSAAWPLRFLIVNNGHPDSPMPVGDSVMVLQAGRNLGWEGGLDLGIQHSTAEYVVFGNDDIFMPPAMMHWARMLMQPFRHGSVAAVGPTSNVVMGAQNVFSGMDHSTYEVPFLIGFFVLVRRSALDAVGGVDPALPGGDDLDLSLRFRRAGFQCVMQRNVFVYHHGFKTGQRLHGAQWNSQDMTERTDNALIRKHGLGAWSSLWQTPESYTRASDDVEGQAVASQVIGPRVLELGCGDKVTVPHAVGVDLVPAGETSYLHQTSAAQVCADVFQPMPMFEDGYADTVIARHIFEHAVNPVAVLVEWSRLLRPKGRLIVACPNGELMPTIPLDVTHKHEWSPDSLRSLAELCGYRQLAYTPNCGNGVSFVTVLERP